ncbi:unnamed protein product, partial [Ascophyllum nodosum]
MRGREIAVATHNVRTMAVDGTHGVGRALDVLSVYDRLGYDVVGLQETRRSGQPAFSQAGYLVYCSVLRHQHRWSFCVLRLQH